jgi:capsular exopolysaccharide synthesis family protein
MSNDPTSPLRRQGGARELRDVRLPQAENETLLMMLVRVIQHRKWTILAAFLVLPVLTLLAISRVTPLYTAYETVLYEPKKANVIDLQAVLEPTLTDATIESQIEIIKSRNVAQQVVDALGLVLRPEFNPDLERSKLADAKQNLFARFYRGLVGIFGEKTVGAAAPNPVNDRAANDAVVQNVLERVDIEAKGRSSVMEIRFTSEDPVVAREVVTKFANLYIDNQLELKFQSMKRASDWLNARLDQLRQQVDTSERAVEEFRTQAGLTEGVGGGNVITETVSGMNRDFLEAQTTLANAQATLEAIRAFARSPGRMDSIPTILANPSINTLREQETTLLGREAELSARVGPRHPDLLELRAQIARLRDRIFEEVGRVARGIENEVRVAEARVDALKGQFTRTQGTASKADAAMIRLRALEREARADQDLLQTFLAKSKEITQQYEIEEPDARILSPAYSSTEPTFPKTTLFLAIAALAGLVLGFTLAYLEELLDQTFRTAEDVESALALPAVAVPLIGKSNWKMPFLDYVLIKPSSIFAESLRSLRTLLWLTDLQSRAKLVAVTSSRRGEGKTTTAVSLARVAALSGERVIIVDCDLTRPTIHTAFKQTSADVGLTDLLLGRASRREATKVDQSLPNLHYITAGGRSERLNELLRTDNMIALLREARNEYDLVVVDTPPCLVVSDAKVVATMCDAVVYCIGWRQTSRSVANTGINALHAVGANVLCAALTQMRFRSLRARDRSDYEAYASGRAARTGTAGDTPTLQSH